MRLRYADIHMTTFLKNDHASFVDVAIATENFLPFSSAMSIGSEIASNKAPISKCPGMSAEISSRSSESVEAENSGTLPE